MTQKQIELVKSTWSAVAAMDHVVVGGLFYNRLFEIAPQLKSMFHNPIPEQSKKLLAMVNYVIIKLDKLDDILGEVSKLAHRHTGYGVKPAHYAIVGEALLWTLEKGLGDKWTEETSDAWIACYTILSNAMIAASGEEVHKAA
ncbi:MAG TPA: globin domain-containing protein, partial [Chitinophagaceae bacterium]|nr:globin domain-containing protein [Chitinophagaceae bacterium]